MVYFLNYLNCLCGLWWWGEIILCGRSKPLPYRLNKSYLLRGSGNSCCTPCKPKKMGDLSETISTGIAISTSGYRISKRNFTYPTRRVSSKLQGITLMARLCRKRWGSKGKRIRVEGEIHLGFTLLFHLVPGFIRARHESPYGPCVSTYLFLHFPKVLQCQRQRPHRASAHKPSSAVAHIFAGEHCSPLR